MTKSQSNSGEPSAGAASENRGCGGHEAQEVKLAELLSNIAQVSTTRYRWLTPAYKVIDTGAEVTAYFHKK